MKIDFDKPFTIDRIARIAIIILLVFGGITLIRMLSTVLLPFAIAMVLAYLTNPLVEFFQHRLKIRNRIISVMATTIGLLGIVALTAVLVVPKIATEVKKFWNLISRYTEETKRREIISESFEGKIREFLSSERVAKLFDQQSFVELGEKYLPDVWNFVTSSLNIVIGILAFSIIILYYIFILLDYDRIRDGWKDLVPPRIKAMVLAVVQDLQNGMSRYFRAQAVVALTVGILFAIGFKIISLPLGILLGLFVGMLNLVPYLQIIGFVPAIFLALLKSMETGQSIWLGILMVVIVFTVVQLIQDAFIVPKIMGKETGLKPAVILLSLSIWGSLLGLLGMIVALPLTTVLLSYYKRFIRGESITGEEEVFPDPPD